MSPGGDYYNITSSATFGDGTVYLSPVVCLREWRQLISDIPERPGLKVCVCDYYTQQSHKARDSLSEIVL